MIRVAILTNYPHDESTLVGGVETATEGLLEGLEKYQGEFEFHIVALSKEIETDRTEQRRGFFHHYLAVPRSPVLRPRTLYNALACARKIRDLRPDLVHCQDNMSLALGAIRAGRADLFTLHGIKREEARRWEGREYWSHQMDAVLERYVHPRFTAFISVSAYGQRMLPPGRTCHVLPNALSRQWFTVREALRSGVPRILCVGSYNRLKRQHILLHSVKSLRDEGIECNVVCAGSRDDEAYFEELNRFVSSNGLKDVGLQGPVTRKDLLELMSATTVLVHPSAQENSPMIIAEAMASGVPVVAASVGGIPEMIDDCVHGLLVKPDDENLLVQTIKRIVSDNQLRRALAQKARERATEMFSADAVAAGTVAVYRKMMGER
jgi:glycosyltransferase involved in cell wall biosynthesis